MTNDVLAALSPIARALKWLTSEFYVSEPRVREAVAARRSFNVIHLATMMKVDVADLLDRALAAAEAAEST